MEFKLGKLPAREDPRTFRLSAIMRTIPALPYEFDVDVALGGVQDDNAFGNLQYGDCAIAGRAHMTLRFEKREQGVVIPIVDADVVTQYFKETGGPDAGLVMLDSLNLWRKDGWTAAGQSYDIFAFTKINWLNHPELMSAIYLLGGAYAGVMLPYSAASQMNLSQTWDVVPDSEGGTYGSWGGHAIYVMAYNAIGPVCITWGKRQQMTWAWWDKYGEECYAVVDDKNHWSPTSPLDVDALAALLAEITGSPIPAPVPPVTPEPPSPEPIPSPEPVTPVPVPVPDPVPEPPPVVPPAPEPTPTPEPEPIPNPMPPAPVYPQATGCCPAGRTAVKLLLRTRLVTFKRKLGGIPMVKAWYTSKTLWLNALALAVAIVQALQGQPWFSMEIQVGILAVLNAIVRFLTSQPITQDAAVKLQAKLKTSMRKGGGLV